MLNKLIALFVATIAMASWTTAYAINAGEDIDKTIVNLYDELQYNQKMVNDELSAMQNSRKLYWESIDNLQKEVDKAALILYAQDGGSLFSIGLASEGLNSICEQFSKEKTPFENWLQTMTTASNRHGQIRKALQRIHTESLSPETVEYIDKSISICDSLNARFASIRDSILLDQQRYEKLSAEIKELEDINSKVVDMIRSQIFQYNNEDFLTIFSTFNYSDFDYYYDPSSSQNLGSVESENSLDDKIDRWGTYNFLIALIVCIVMGITLRFVPSKNEGLRSKRWYYAFLAFLVVLIIGQYLMPGVFGLNNYMRHIHNVFLDGYSFIFWMVLAATLRLKRPGLGWSISTYLPLFFLNMIIISLASGMSRNMTLKTTVPFLFLFALIWTIVTLAIGLKRIPKADYLTVFSCTGVIFISTALAFIGFYYPAIILVLYAVSVMTYVAVFACLKRFFAKRINLSGPILHLSLNYLIYPYFFIYILVQSLNEVANVFNLTAWLDKQFVTPFISIPQFGIISVSRIILLIGIGIFVNYAIKLIKLLLLRHDKEKYGTGSHAVAITLGTMITWFGFGIFALMMLHINHSGIIAAIGGASLGIGFAMKETLENLISGLQLMSSRARPGDLVVCEGARGTIRHIGILSTLIEIEDGPIVSFPNRKLLSSTFTNLSLNHRREIRHIIFDISADSDLELAKALMLEASQGIDGVVDHDKHYVVMRNTNSGIVRLDYKCWIDSARYLRAEPAVREAIFRAFRENDIKIADFANELGVHLNNKVLI